MANPKHVELIQKALQTGNSAAWNQWRGSKYRMDERHGYRSLVEVDLSGTDLRGHWSFSHLDLADANFQDAKLQSTNFHSANLRRANLRGANLYSADLRRAVLDGADLSGADLRQINLGAASLIEVNLSDADLFNASLNGTRLQQVNLSGANLCSCRVYGVSAWDVKLDGANQSDLVITPPDSPTIKVDNLEVAQFIYLLSNNEAIRRVIDTITSKVVLILGRFTEKRIAILDALRTELRRRGFTPVLFDFDKPAGKDVTGTVETLARMARFIIADLTDPSSIPHELATIVPFLRTTPVLPLRLAGSGGYSMFDDLQRAYRWVLKVQEYKDEQSLLVSLSKILAPADKLAEKMRASPRPKARTRARRAKASTPRGKC